MRGKKPLTAAQPEALKMRLVPRHRVTRRLSPIIILPLAERTRRPLHARVRAFTATRCRRRLDPLSLSIFKLWQLKQDEKVAWKFFVKLLDH